MIYIQHKATVARLNFR